eukprot:CAMPEP_0179181690 /NCGR_PEP_ID=MMETSP0796-20121207/89996_1 /TAXON_ID=73915 /ORGANISM="Pyrodinium bahamense, Strain pbaha01" /LENGTH=221 /DNA_ID=CAMNT_0020885481 /DNA_START=1 /DNA_END=662 /DNA_ORIENTATION=-
MITAGCTAPRELCEEVSACCEKAGLRGLNVATLPGSTVAEHTPAAQPATAFAPANHKPEVSNQRQNALAQELEITRHRCQQLEDVWRRSQRPELVRRRREQNCASQEAMEAIVDKAASPVSAQEHAPPQASERAFADLLSRQARQARSSAMAAAAQRGKKGSPMAAEKDPAIAAPAPAWDESCNSDVASTWSGSTSLPQSLCPSNFGSTSGSSCPGSACAS